LFVLIEHCGLTLVEEKESRKCWPKTRAVSVTDEHSTNASLSSTRLSSPLQIAGAPGLPDRVVTNTDTWKARKCLLEAQNQLQKSFHIVRGSNTRTHNLDPPPPTSASNPNYTKQAPTRSPPTRKENKSRPKTPASQTHPKKSWPKATIESNKKPKKKKEKEKKKTPILNHFRRCFLQPSISLNKNIPHRLSKLP
jgi:hypothetical protein